MENADVFLGLHDFLERMRQPSAADFVKSIKSFIVSFSNNAPDPERDSCAVQEFLANTEAAFKAHPLWAGCSEDELDSAGEGLEKYVMTKLFTRVFASNPVDVKTDEQFSEKTALVQQFVRPENLDIKSTFQNESSWLLAQKELQKINMYKAPRDKLVCILNCCKVINNLLHNASIASNENPPGADEFLPVLIYVTIKANPPQLHSNLLYIQRYRRETRLVGEAAYFFTNMLSAESFISNIDAQALSMEESEFESNMESARALLSGLATDMDSLPSQCDQSEGKVSVEHLKDSKYPAINTKTAKEHLGWSKSAEKKVTCKNDQEPITKVPSLSELENKGATMLLKESKASEVFQEYPYLFAQVGDLTINDVEDLLNNYKQLVFKYVCLSEGLGGATPSLPPPVLQTEVQQSADTTKEHNDCKIVELNIKSQRDTSLTNGPPNQVLISDEEKVEAQLAEEEANTELGGKNDETSQ